MYRVSLSVLALCAALPASADMSGVAQLSVIPGWQTADGTQMAGLSITLAPGWKTYWRAPGDGGIPPMIDVRGSRNIDATQFHWPVPEVFYQNNLRSIGYSGGIVLPLELNPTADGPMQLTGTIQIGVCQEVCVPVTFDFDTLLPRANTARDPDLLAAVLDRPQTADEAGVETATCAVAPNENGLELTATVTGSYMDGIEAMVVEAGDTSVWVSEPTTHRQGDQISGTVDMISNTGAPILLDRSDVRITLLGARMAVDIQGCSAN
jgi:DsbC/DsbD-like thiol-disulfide interchange protein